MNFYTLNTTYPFGRYKGETLEDVAKLNISYINWCLESVVDFYIAEEIFNKIKEIEPSYTFSKEAIERIENGNEDDCDDNDYDYHDHHGDYDWGGLSGEEAEIGYWNTN